MTDSVTMQRIAASLPSRHRANSRLKYYGLAAICAALGFLALMLVVIVAEGSTAFKQTTIALDVEFDPQKIDPKGTSDPEVIRKGDFQGLVKESLRRAFPEVKGRQDKRELYSMVSSGAGFELREMVLNDPSLIGRTETVWLLASDDIDMVAKGRISREGESETRRVSDQQLGWYDDLEAVERLDSRFNKLFFTSGDSREPELAGVLGAVMGSFYALLVCLLLAFPLGVMASIYLEEFAPKNKWTELIEVNINNLAAVPSIVFGLLGLAMFLGLMGLPRSAPLVGGMVLALMTLPTIVIAGRAAIKAVPPSIKQGAMALGASPVQAVFQQVLPLAMPGMLTGTIIGMAQALGESAPLLMIGMVAFIVDVPSSVVDPATALPVQVYIWADSPERAFVEKTSAAIMVLLVFLMCMNILAVYLRKRFEKSW